MRPHGLEAAILSHPDDCPIPDSHPLTQSAWCVSVTRRDEILGTQLSDFHDFAEVLAAVRDKGRVVAVTSADKAAAAQADRPGFFDAIHKIL